jgi:Secretion system C-terminal sorting domain/Putative flagellar system-associated repeat/Right handed beta helix region/Bacterial Ig-like domain (group 2)
MRKVLIILFLAINSVLSATNYYVKNSGNDYNSGKDDAHAWAHHPWMSTWTGSTKLVAGDNVFMNRGDSWSVVSVSVAFMYVGQSGNAGSPIITSWYGTSGAKPLIQITGDTPYPVIQGIGKSFITFDHLEIKHYSSTPNVSKGQYGIVFGKDGSSNVSHNWIITNCDIHNIPHTGIAGTTDSYNIIIGDITTLSCATVASYSNQIYDCGYAGTSMGGCDPVTKNSNFQVYYNYIHDINSGGKGGENAYGISFSAASTSSGWPKKCYAKFNLVKNIVSWEGIDTHGGQYIYFQDNYIYNCMSAIATQLLAVGTLTPILDHCYIERNTIENPGNHPDLSFNFIQMQGPDGGTYRATNSYIRDNILFYTSPPSNESNAYGIKLGPADNVTIERNTIYNGPVGTCSGAMNISGKGTPIRNIKICNNVIYKWNWGIFLGIGGVDGNITFFNNIICSNGKPFGTYEPTPSSYSGDIAIYNNVFLSTSGSNPSYDIDFTKTIIPNGSSLIIKNNILGFTSPLNSGRYIISPTTVTGTLIIDYNQYWNSKKSDPYDLQGVSYKWTDWNVLGYDIHSLNNIDPLFINKSGSYSESQDFVLQSTSPAINKGIDVYEVTQDFFGNPRDATPDIGAYEYVVQVTGITVTGATESNTITTDKGTLQLISSVLPDNAANKKVAWSLVNGTGQASISSSGLVTASSNGTVTARATATDGSGVYGTLLITITNQIVTDSLVLVNSVIENNSPAVLEVVYNITVANVIPATSAFSITVNSTARNINTMTISGTKVLLTLASPVVNSDIITVAYSKPSSNPLQAASGGQASSVGPLPVTNKVGPKSYVPKPVKIFPNPAHDFINIQIAEPTLVPDFIRIIDLTGKVVSQNKVKPDIKDFKIPIKLMQGVYILLMGSGNQILFTQKLIVAI